MNTTPRLWAVLVTLLGGFLLAGPAASAEPMHPTQNIRGLWVWRESAYTTPEARRELLAFAKEQGLNRLMLQVHRTKAADGPVALKAPDALRELVIEAGNQGIAVEALDGAPDMGLRPNQAAAMHVLDLVLEFNRSLPEDRKLAGIHYDIEPYVLPAWKTPQREQIMRETLEFFTGVAARLRVEAPDLTLACDIPFWYDNKTEQGDSCELEYLGRRKNFHQHIQDVMDYVGIMSYRRKAEGSNSVVAVIENELAYAAKIGRSVCASLETGKVDEAPTISFYGQPASAYRETLAKVEEVLKDKPGYGGVLIHHYHSLRELLEKPQQAAAQ